MRNRPGRARTVVIKAVLLQQLYAGQLADEQFDRDQVLQDLTEAVGLGGASLRTATTWETARGRDSQAKCLVNQQF